MKEEKDILAKIDRQSGMTVPDGYFESFAASLEQNLPVRDEAENPEKILLPPPTLWTRVRPYVYLAAMFAGVWCMLKMFVLMSSPTDGNAAIDRNPILAEALGNDAFVDEYIIDDINQWDLFDEMMDDGVDASSFDLAADSGFNDGFIDPAALQVQND